MEQVVTTARSGVNERYLRFLMDVKAAIDMNPNSPMLNKIRAEHKVGAQLTTILQKMDVIEKRRGYYYWNAELPSYDLVRQVRDELKTYNREAKKGFTKVEILTPAKRNRRWSLTKSVTIFKTKIRIYKLK